jgi:hypothetical protein
MTRWSNGHDLMLDSIALVRSRLPEEPDDEAFVELIDTDPEELPTILASVSSLCATLIRDYIVDNLPDPEGQANAFLDRLVERVISFDAIGTDIP